MIDSSEVDFSQKQLKAISEATSRIVIYSGAVRSGKSYASIWKLIKMAKHAPDGNLIVCGKSQATIKRNVVSELQNLVGDRYAQYSVGRQELTLFGRVIDCVGATDERAEGKIRGSTYSGALVDEATLMPEGFFKMLLSRLSRDGAQLVGTTNPDSPFHWLKKDYIDRQSELDLQVFDFVLEDNPSLSSTYIQNLKKEYQGLWYKRFIMGEWCLAEGSVYDFFDEKIHVINRAPTYAKKYFVGIDYGTTNPFASVLVGFNDEVTPALWVEKEYYFDSRRMGYQKTDADYSRDLSKWLEGYPITRAFIDPSAASFRLELRRAMPQLSIMDANNDVLSGIRCVSTHMTQGNLKIHKDCKNLIGEMFAYVWDKNSIKLGEDKPLKQSDHLQDALRYVLYTAFGDKKSLKEKSKEQRDIERWEKMPVQQKLESWGYR